MSQTGISTPSGTIDFSTLSVATVSNRYFDSVSELSSFLSGAVSDPLVLRVSNVYARRLATENSDYFIQVDSAFANDYRSALNAHAIVFLRAADARAKRLTAEGRSEALQAVKILESSYAKIRNPAAKYVRPQTVSGRIDVTVSRTLDAKIAPALSKLENKYVGKILQLADAGGIDATERQRAIAAWNDFVLHLSVYRATGGNALSKVKALEAIRIFSATYAKKVPDVPSEVDASKDSAMTPAFVSDLAYASSSDDVRRLQEVLKNEGYFGTLSPTGYFGPSTKAYLAQFAKEKLGIPNSDGTFDRTVREALNAYLVR